MKQVLIIEDDEDLLELISIHLADLNCQFVKTPNGKEGFQLASKGDFDLIVLDIMLPEMDGLEICRKLRAMEVNTPILMLTAKSEEIDKVLGLETGADDYLIKPFGVREFIARVKAILRRTTVNIEIRHALDSKHLIQFGNLKIDLNKHKIMLNGLRIELTPKEYDLLVLLASNPGRSYSREELLNIVWGYEFSGYEHTVNSHINRLRSKIESDFSKPSYILTTWGIGYRFTDDTPNTFK